MKTTFLASQNPKKTGSQMILSCLPHVDLKSPRKTSKKLPKTNCLVKQVIPMMGSNNPEWILVCITQTITYISITSSQKLPIS
jgi:hypothetical protein